MTFTAIHRALGEEPGDLDAALIAAAIAAGVSETDGLDWKRQLPAPGEVKSSDFIKDVAAMANSGGGIIVYGVKEKGKRATGYAGGVELTEQLQRSMTTAFYLQVEPPVLGVQVRSIGEGDQRVVVVEVPGSDDAPHLIHTMNRFGAPIRYDADTHWMRERQIEMAYRRRFDVDRRAAEALDILFAGADRSRPYLQRPWFVGVGHPRTAHTRDRFDKPEALHILRQAERLGRRFAGYRNLHPLDIVNLDDVRPGLRRWVAPNHGDRMTGHRETWASVHDDGSVSVAASVGEIPLTRSSVQSVTVECCIADLMALVRETGQARANFDYDVRVGMTWGDGDVLRILSPHDKGRPDVDSAIPLYGFEPVDVSVDTDAPLEEYFRLTRRIAEDCVNQGGIGELHAFKKGLWPA